jgi:hypothetical protein
MVASRKRRTEEHKLLIASLRILKAFVKACCRASPSASKVFWTGGGIATFPVSERTKRSLCKTFQARTRLCFDDSSSSSKSWIAFGVIAYEQGGIPGRYGLGPYVDFAHPLSAVSHKVPPKLSAISSVFKTDPISGLKSCDHTAVAQKRDSVAISISETHTRCLGQYQSAISAYFTNSTESTVCPSPLILTCALTLTSDQDPDLYTVAFVALKVHW